MSRANIFNLMYLAQQPSDIHRRIQQIMAPSWQLSWLLMHCRLNQFPVEFAADVYFSVNL